MPRFPFTPEEMCIRDRYRAGDGLHTKEMKVSGLPSKEKAIEAWNRMAENG